LLSLLLSRIVIVAAIVGDADDNVQNEEGRPVEMRSARINRTFHLYRCFDRCLLLYPQASFLAFAPSRRMMMMMVLVLMLDDAMTKLVLLIPFPIWLACVVEMRSCSIHRRSTTVVGFAFADPVCMFLFVERDAMLMLMDTDALDVDSIARSFLVS
jgi:hypothetical protein